jgi:virulence factor Mce-like protein
MSSQTRENRYRRHARASAVAAALGLVLLTAAIFFKFDPFANSYEVRALFMSSAELKPGSPVRIAGIQVGQVNAIGAGPGAETLVTMGIDSNGLPIHADATLTIKPRLVLEGNDYIDLDPGTPSAPDLSADATIPLAHTAISVQLDQVLDVLDIPTRDALQSSVSALADGLGRAPGGTGPGWRSLRSAVSDFDGALGPVSQLAESATGTQPGDLSRAISSTSNVTAQLAEDPAALSDIVTSYDRTFEALADQDRNLGPTVDGIDAVLRTAPAPLRELDAALPQLTGFANQLRPALRDAPVAFTDGAQLLSQIRALVRPRALPALLTDLPPVLSDLPSLEGRLGTLFSYSTPVTDCISTHIVPTLDMKIHDGANTTGDPVYLDLMHLFTGLTSVSSAVDANGGTLRLGLTTGDRIVDTVFPGLGQVVGRLPNADGVRPVWLGAAVNPPYRPDQPCASQALPDLNTPAASGVIPQWARATNTLPASAISAPQAPATRHSSGARPARHVSSTGTPTSATPTDTTPPTPTTPTAAGSTSPTPSSPTAQLGASLSNLLHGLLK